MQTVIEVLRCAADHLRESNIEQPRRQAEELLGHILQIPRMQLYLEHDRPVEKREQEQLNVLIQRRSEGEPLQYILGRGDFFGCRLAIDRRALIPRPETEYMVERVLSQITGEGKTLLDLCTGSGCMAIALKRTRPSLHVIATDISSQALSLAQENAETNGVEIEFLQGDLFEPLGRRKIDYCVCNPPYVVRSDISHLQPEVRDFEPLNALDGGEDGLVFYRRLSEDLPRHLSSPGKAWLEIGAEQKDEVQKLFKNGVWTDCLAERDMAGFDRFIFLVKE